MRIVFFYKCCSCELHLHQTPFVILIVRAKLSIYRNYHRRVVRFRLESSRRNPNVEWNGKVARLKCLSFFRIRTQTTPRKRFGVAQGGGFPVFVRINSRAVNFHFAIRQKVLLIRVYKRWAKELFVVGHSVPTTGTCAGGLSLII